MAKISALPVSTALTGAEHLPILQGTATKRVTMAAFRDLITPFLQNWYKGDKGDTGASNNTRVTLAQLRAAPIEDTTSLFDGSVWTWTPGDFSGQLDTNTVKSDYVPLTDGAWKRQGAAAVGYGYGTVGDALDEIVSVTRFGRITGVADDAVLARALATGKSVKIPTGVTLGLTQDVVLAPRQALFGEGWTSRVLLFSNHQPDNIKIRLASGSSILGLSIQEVGASGRTGYYGSIFGDNVANCRVSGVEVSGSSSTGMMFVNCDRITVDGCHVHNTWADGIHAQRGSTRIVVIGCQIWLVEDDGVALVAHGHDDYGDVSDCVVSDNIITDIQKTGSGIAGIGVIGLIAKGNRIARVPLAGIRIASASFGDEGACVAGQITIQGNQITDTGLAGPEMDGERGGIFIEGARDVTVATNKIIRPKTWGIATSNGWADIDITGNTIVGAGDVAMFISAAQQAGHYLGLWNHPQLDDGTRRDYAAGHDISITRNILRSCASSGIVVSGDVDRFTDGVTVRDNELRRMKTSIVGIADAIFIDHANGISVGGNINRAPVYGLRGDVTLGNVTNVQGVENSSLPRRVGLSADAATWIGSSRHFYFDRVPQGGEGPFSAGDVIWNWNPGTGVLCWVCTDGGTPGTWQPITVR